MHNLTHLREAKFTNHLSVSQFLFHRYLWIVLDEYWRAEHISVHLVSFLELVTVMYMYVITSLSLSLSPFSRIDDNLSKSMKIYPLPHMYVVKDLVPVSPLISF